MLTTLLTLIRLRIAEIEAEGYRLAGNMPGLRDAAARIALLRAQLRPLGSTGGDDDDEDGADDDLKVAA